ncbi:hypothetical protein [Sinorhizobium sp. BG8]|uniref:portal protein n=1 Tax=Sinorhizobium sp. BG8 TaxID=2613773 RepID=UPI00193EB462|nr:hypothetical protein [Sinorhizobium sp. BG8]QRM54739.1 hypothetical protein F3Y30_09430 [Sinorhizobium sp. BG8]
MAKITKIKKVDEDALVNSIAKAVQEAVGVSATHIANKQEEALKLYMREPFPTDKKGDGKSKWVSSDVQERTDWATSQLIRVFDNQQQVVSFAPNEPSDQPIADQMTEVCNFVVRSKNSHVAMLAPWVKNGFLTGLGITMVELKKVREESLPEIMKAQTDQQLVERVAEEEAGTIVIEERGEPYVGPQQAPVPDLPPELAALAAQMQPKVRDIKIRRVSEKPQINICNLPPEDFIVSKDADIDQQTGGIRARLQGHKRIIGRAELIELGFDEKKVAAIPSADSEEDGMALQRSKETDYDDGVGDVEDDVLIYEVYTRMAVDGGKRRHYRFVLGGDITNKPVLLHREEVSKFYPYAAFVPYPIPNTLFGQGMVDRVGPTQRLTTQIIRQQHNNLNKVIDPLVVVNPDVTRPDDLLNLHPGKVIRSEDPNAGLSFIQPPFVAMQAQPIIDNLKTELDYTTGVGGALASVNASDLQNTTATANAQRASSQQMLVEQICRHFADTGYRYLFRIIVDLFTNNPEEAHSYITRLTGQFTPLRVDAWDPDMDVTANVAFGVTDKIGNAGNLNALLGLQQTLQPMGLANAQTIYHTATRLAENAGEKNSSAFFVDPSTLPPAPPAPPPPDPNAALIAEMKLKAQLDAEAKAREYEFEMNKLIVENDLKRDQMAQDLELKRAEIEAKYQAQVDIARIQQEQARQRNDVDFAIAAQDAQVQVKAAQEQQQTQAMQAQAAQQQPAMPPQAPMMPPQQ